MSVVPFACPSCRAAVAASAEVLTCVRCSRSYRHSEGVYRFLLTTDPDVERFHRQYHEVRSRDGSHRQSAVAYRELPDVANDDPRAGEWAVRRQSFGQLVRVVQQKAAT